MSTRAFLTVALGLSLISPQIATAQDASATFTKTPPKMKAGDIITSKQNFTSNTNAEVAVNGNVMGNFKMANEEAGQYLVTIVTVDAKGVPNKVSVAFKDLYEKQVQQGQSSTKKSPISNKTFHITRGKDSKHSVTDDKGKAVGAETAKLVLDEAGEFVAAPDASKKNEFHDMLTAKPVKVGQKFKLNKKQIRALLEDETFENGNVTITLRSLGKTNGFKSATFDITLAAVMTPEEGLSMTLNMTGTLVLTLEGCAPASLDMKGPLTLAGSKDEGGAKMTMSGKGTAKMDAKIHFLPKK